MSRFLRMLLPQYTGALVHEILIQAGRDHEDLRVLFCLDENVEHHVGHDAGGGEQADVHLEEPADGDLPALVAEQVGPELAAFHQDHALALGAAVVDDGAALDLLQLGHIRKPLLLLPGQLVPNGKILGKFHCASLLGTSISPDGGIVKQKTATVSLSGKYRKRIP